MDKNLTIRETYDDGLYKTEIKAAEGLTKEETIFLLANALVFAENQNFNTFLMCDAGMALWSDFSENDIKPNDTPAQRILRFNIHGKDGDIFLFTIAESLFSKGCINLCDGTESYHMTGRGVLSEKGINLIKDSNPTLYSLIEKEGKVERPFSTGENNNIFDKVCSSEEKSKKSNSESFHADDTEAAEEKGRAPMKEQAYSNIMDLSPKEIEEKLDRDVYSQEEAKKAASLMLWMELHGLRRNCIFIGPSGCGKTEIFRSLKKIYKNIYIYDASTVTSEGWKGSKKYYSVFEDMYKAGFSKYDMEHSIVVFDEFDKLATPQFDSHGNVHDEIQGEFLSMVEGTDLKISNVKINTSTVSFAFLGAFESLTMKVDREEKKRGIGFGETEEPEDDGKPIAEITIPDLIKFGLKPELAGRISNITRLRGFDKKDFSEILKGDRAGIVSRIAGEFGMKNISISDEKIMELSENAESTGLGIRYLNTEIRNMVDNVIYETGKIPEAI